MSRIFSLSAVCLLTVKLCLAQSELGTGAINGEVSDPGGRSVVDAAVTVVNTETGLTRRTTTGSGGQFSVPVLPPGNYSVRIEKPGFAVLEWKDLVVNVGSSASVIATLKLGVVQQVIKVEATPTIETTKTEEASLVSRTEIQDLPLNGRRYDQFALLTPGVTRDATFGLLSFRGMSGVWNNFMVEGNDDNQAYNSEARGRTRVASNLSFDAIQEFQVGRSNFQAEFGRAVGGNINAVVRSGGNSFHADGFYYYKDRNLSARDPFASFKPFERRQQFGGSVGGPIKRDKLFYFANYDQQSRDWPLIFQDTNGVLTQGRPSPSSPDLAAFNAGVNFLLSKMPGGAPGNALPRNFNHNLALGKVDWLANAKNTVSITYNYLNHRADNGILTNVLVTNSLGSNGRDEVHTHSLYGRLTTTVSPRAVNEFRTEWSRDFEFQFSSDPPPNTAIGFFSFGKSTSQDNLASPDERHYQFTDNFTLITGRHNLKFGGEIEYITEFLNKPNNFSGGYSYGNALAFGKDLLNPAGRNYTQYRQSFGLAIDSFGVTNYAGFIQDQWRVYQRLTVNLGLRYDYQALPSPLYPNPAIPESNQINSDHTNFGPRGGIAWDLRGNGHTLVRFGYGMFFSPTPLGTIDNVLRQTGLSDPTKALLALTFHPTDPGAPSYPNTFSQLPTGGSASAPFVTRLDPGFRRPRAQEVNVGVERLLPAGITLSASYIYTKGNRLPFTFDTNLPLPNFTRTYQLPDGTTFTVPFTAGVTRTAAGVSQNVDASRPNPNAGQINVIRPLGLSWYNAFLLEARRRLSKGFEFQIAYTLARAEDVAGTGDGSGRGDEGPFGGFNILDQFNLENNRSRASTDQRHRLVASAVWNLPFGKHSDSLSSRLVHNFRVSEIFTAQSGRPYPTGLSITSIPFSTPDGTQWNGFGSNPLGQGGSSLLPSVPRNNNTGDANYSVDLRVSREFHFKERYAMEVLGEGFNLFNRSNFNQYNSTRYDAVSTAHSPPQPPDSLSTTVRLVERTNFGTPFGDGGPPDGTNARRFQLALRFRF